MSPQAQPPAVPATTQSSLWGDMAALCGMDRKEFIGAVLSVAIPKRRVRGELVNPTESQAAAVLAVALEYKLNPFTKEVAFFWGKGDRLQAVVPIDGWAKLVLGNPAYCGHRFIYEWHDPKKHGGKRPAAGLVSVTCIMRRKVASGVIEIEATEWMEECFRGSVDTWTQWPRRQLRTKAYNQCARLAFGFAGIMDRDEYERWVEVEDVRTTEPAPAKPRTLEDAVARLPQGAPEPDQVVEAETETFGDPATELDAALDAGEPDSPPIDDDGPPILRVRGVAVPLEWLDSWADWSVERCIQRNNPKDALNGHTWASAAQGPLDGGRHRRLEWTAAQAAEKQSLSAWEERALVALYQLLVAHDEPVGPLPAEGEEGPQEPSGGELFGEGGHGDPEA